MAILWSATHDAGNMSEWYLGNGGGEFNSGAATTGVSTDMAHSGRYSVKCTNSQSGSGTRLFRWGESRQTMAAYYSCWYYFPTNFSASWWNIFQFKSRTNSTTPPDPFWYVQVGRRSNNGPMYLYLTWWPQLWSDRGVAGPHAGETGGRNYQQQVLDLPPNRWVHIEAFLRQSSGFDGEIVIWQDGVEILRQTNVKTRYAGVGDEWSVDNYGSNISPSPTTIYIDDAVISTTRIGPGQAQVAPEPPSNLRIITS